jgi:hypothetical protein
MRLILLCFFLVTQVFAQDYNFSNAWQFVGPSNKPDAPTNISASGVGPIEFIRVYQKNPQHLLAGSLSGGLFFSEDGGENWINSGSDAWDYSGCGWADFYPENEKVWFAFSNHADNNGKPGKTGMHGGIMRSMNSGASWEKVASGASLFGSEEIAVYGFRFFPGKPKVMFVLSDAGLFYTENCLSETVSWKKVSAFDGMIYDLDFIDDQAFVSVFQHGKWNLMQFDFEKMSAVPNQAVAALLDDKRSITFEPRGDKLLVLIDYSKLNDELWEMNPENGETTKLLSSVQVNFGSGHTFAVNPHNEDEFLIGNSTTLKRWNYKNLRERKLGSGYHVDVEFVAYDPADSNKIYMACHGGVYISNDQGQSWINKSNGLGVAEVMGMAVSETDPNEIVIGTFHDGSSVLADFDKNGNYTWRTVNGGDALTPLIDPANAAVVYTSTQFTGGGIYYSKDTAKNFVNIHAINQINTSGWELSAVLHPANSSILYFNYARKEDPSKGCYDIVRTINAGEKKNAEVISDFGTTHQLASYKVYGLFNNPFFPDHLYAYVLHFDKNEEGKAITRHRLFKSEIARDSSQKILESWYELELPLSSWMGDIEGDPTNPDQIYISYVGARDVRSNAEWTTSLIYAVKYNKKTKALKRSIDISRNLPYGVSGRFNLEFISSNEKELFFATRSGVYYGNEKTLKGKADWIQVGYGLPHCKIYGLHYHEQTKTLTVGLFGRGVWRYYF